MKPRVVIAMFLLSASAVPAGAQQPVTREMNDLNWMEFRQIVPAKVKTVLVTVGTLEPHGVINNGADNTAPIAIARAIADDANALIAPHIPFGVTGSMAPFPGAIHIPDEAFRGYFRAVMEGMVKNGFRNIVILNGHGGPQTAILQQVASDVAMERKVNTLVVNWWAVASDASMEIFNTPGGHAAINETAFIQAINPKLVRKELFTGKDMATANPAPGTWSATPYPSSMTLYKEGEGWPTDFNQVKADEYFRKVVARVKTLVLDTLRKWEMAGFN